MGERKFTQHDEAIRLYQEGATLTDISKLYNVHVTTIMRALNKRGIQVVHVIPTIPDTLALAYYAGIFDGEGHVTIAASKRENRVSYWLQMGIVGTYKPILENIQKDFGVGHITLFSHSGKDNRLPCWAWRCTSNQAMFVLEALLPFLRIKLDVAKLGVEFQKCSKDRPGEEWQLSIKQKITAINKMS